MQELTINPRITVELPANLIIIDRTEYEQLKHAELYRTWTMADIKDATGKGDWWVVREVFDRYRDELDVKSGGFVHYPTAKGQPWRMDAHKMSDWLESHNGELRYNAKRRVTA